MTGRSPVNRASAFIKSNSETVGNVGTLVTSDELNKVRLLIMWKTVAVASCIKLCTK